MNGNIDVLFHDEAQLLDWGESRSTGAWIKVRLPDADSLEVFRGMDTATMKKAGHILNLTICQGDIIAAEEETPREYGDQAKQLKLSGFFRNPKVWECIGTDAEFLAWIRKQPSALSGSFGEYLHGEGRSVAAHVRRVANGAGTSIKPPYSAIPLTDAEHQLQHQQGESAVAEGNWWDKKRIQYVERWAWETLKETLEFSSWAEVPPLELREWAALNGIERFLPEAYQ